MAETFGILWFGARWLCSALAGCILFKRAGIPAWKSAVPVYSGLIYYGLVWNPLYYFVYLTGVLVSGTVLQCLVVTPFFIFLLAAALTAASVVVRFLFFLRLARSFGKGIGYAVGFWLFEPVFKVILAAGASEFRSPAKDREPVVFDEGAGAEEKPEMQATGTRWKRVLAGSVVCMALAAGYMTDFYFLRTDYVWITAGNFPDENFRKYLMSQDYGRDMKISENEIYGISEIDCSGREIESLKGIEFLPELRSLDCRENNLTELDLSGNGAVYTLDCSGNKLNSLDLSKNTGIRTLDCSSNGIGTLKLSRAGRLYKVDCSDNKVTELELGDSGELCELVCTNNRLTEIDLSRCAFLDTLDCRGNAVLSVKESREECPYLTRVQMEGQTCEVAVRYDAESGVYKSAENILDAAAVVTGDGVLFDTEKGQICVADPQSCEAQFEVGYSLCSDPIYKAEQRLSGTIRFVEGGEK